MAYAEQARLISGLYTPCDTHYSFAATNVGDSMRIVVDFYSPRSLPTTQTLLLSTGLVKFQLP